MLVGMTATQSLDQLRAAHARATEARDRAANELRDMAANDPDAQRLTLLVASLAADVRDIGARIVDALPNAPRPADVPSQSLLPNGPTDQLRPTDIGSRVPDPMIGARHTVKRGRNKKGATAKVLHRGRATVQGATDWDTDQLARFAGDRAADVVAILASHRLASVRSLTLGSDAVDVTRAADAILAALDVPTLVGTDAESWQRIDGIDRVPRGDSDDDADADAMSYAARCGVALDTLVSLSRHRSGIAGYLASSPDVSFVTAPNTGRKRGADSAWQDHGIDPRQLVPRGGITVADLADVTAPMHTVASWPMMGPRKARPTIPRWRASERDAVCAVRVLLDDGIDAPATYWHDATDGPIPPKGEPGHVPNRVIYWHDANDPTRIVGLSPAWIERFHIGNETRDRGQRANGGSARPTTTAERAARETAARERAESLPTCEVSTRDQVRDLVAALSDDADAVRIIGPNGAIGYVKRSRDGRLRPRVNGARLPDGRTVDRVADVLAIALDVA